jgi:hypothetical protein
MDGVSNWITPTKVFYWRFTKTKNGYPFQYLQCYIWDTNLPYGAKPITSIPVGHLWSVAPSPNNNNVAVHGRGPTTIYSSNGKKIMESSLGGGYREMKWFPDNLMWLEHDTHSVERGRYPFLHTHPYAILGNLRTRETRFLVSSKPLSYLFSPYTQVIQGIGRMVFSIELPGVDVAYDDGSWEARQPLKEALIRKIRISSRKGKSIVPEFNTPQKYPVQYASVVEVKRIVFPEPLCIDRIELSPNCRRILWLCHSPKIASDSKDTPSHNSRTGVQKILVSGLGIKGLRLIEEVKKQGVSTINQMGWRGNDSSLWFIRENNLVLVDIN